MNSALNFIKCFKLKICFFLSFFLENVFISIKTFKVNENHILTKTKNVMRELFVGLAIVLMWSFSFANSVSGQETLEEKPCYNCIKTKTGSQIRFCGTCDWVEDATDCVWTLKDKCTLLPN